MKKRLILMPLLILALVASLFLPAVGCAGETGLKGDQGPMGPQGIQGEQGIQGKQGLQGEQGELGLQGIRGLTGAKGATGSKGAKGAEGDEGERGPRGYSGSKGATGDTGPEGPQGIQGEEGPEGPAGKDAEFPTSTINGIIGPYEWVGATVIPVASEMGTVSVIAYSDYLYVLFDVVDSTDARAGENLTGNDKISININPDVSVGYECDIIFETGTDPAAWPIGPSCGPIDGYETNWVIDGVQVTPLPQDLEAKTIYSAGTRVTEWKIPLASIEGLSAGDTLLVGGACDNLHILGAPQGNSYRYPIILDWSNTSTYKSIPVW